MSLLLSVSACSKAAQTPSADAELLQLRDENARLEAELTIAREKNLQSGRKDSEICGADEGSTSSENSLIEVAGSSEGTSDDEQHSQPPPLRVVTLTPEEKSDDVDEEETVPGTKVVTADQVAPAEGEPSEEATNSSSTRPVLKVRGRHEAWVYHRPLEAAGGTAEKTGNPK